MKICTKCQAKFTSENWICPACGNVPSNVDGVPVLAPALALSGGGFRPDAFAKLAALEHQSFWFRARNRLIVWALRRSFPSIQRYLEIGCGTGYVLEGVAKAYPESALVGSEIFSVGLRYAASRVKSAELVQMDARLIPYEEEFDVIGAFDVLEHIEEDEMVLAAMRRALVPGGGVVITVPQHPWLWSASDETACHVRRYRIPELRDKILRAGFKLEFETSFVSLLLPAMLASRLTKHRAKPGDDSMPELNLSKWLNRVFEIVMNIEHQLIKIGFRFHLGGSRILIATRKM